MTDDPDLSSLRSEGDLNLSPHRTRWQDENLDAETRRLLEEDARYFLHQALSTPCLDALESSRGSTLTDLGGRRFLDFHGNSVHQVGHGHPRVIRAITEQLEKLPFCPRRFTSRPAVELARRLCEAAPGGPNRVLFAPGGASAISMALQVARQATGRFKTISMWDSFHGATLDAISVGGEAIFRRGAGPLLPGAEHVPPPEPRGCPFRCGGTCDLQCAHYLEYVLEKEGDVAAVVAETVRSTPSFPPPDYWKFVREACDRHGTLLILDEIPHALGRTGKLFTCEHYGVEPDLLVIGKGLGGGVFPLAALIARADLDQAAHRALGHFTHEKSPVGAAATLALLDVIEEEGLLERTRRLGEETLEKLRQLEARHASVSEVRGLGLLLGVEVRSPGGERRDHQDLAERVLYGCLSRGLSFKVSQGNVLTLVPPLTIEEGDLARALEILDGALEEVT